MLAFIYVFSICGVATMLFVAVNAIEPNRRYASALKLLIVFVSAAAIAGRLMPLKGDAGMAKHCKRLQPRKPRSKLRPLPPLRRRRGWRSVLAARGD
jgi:hypothetical protein